MTVNYSWYPYTTQDNCAICLNSLNDGEYLVAHEGDGNKHPIHSICVLQWLSRNPSCPTCNVPIDPTSFSSLKERTFYQIFLIKKDAVVGVKGGALGAIAYLGVPACAMMTRFMFPQIQETTSITSLIGRLALGVVIPDTVAIILLKDIVSKLWMGQNPETRISALFGCCVGLSVSSFASSETMIEMISEVALGSILGTTIGSVAGGGLGRYLDRR